MKFMILDNDAVYALLLKKILSKYGRVELYESLESAVNSFTRAAKSGGYYSLVYISQDVEGCNSFELQSLFAKIEAENKVIEMDKAKCVTLTREEAMSGMLHAFLVKPFNEQDIEEQLEALGIGKEEANIKILLAEDTYASRRIAETYLIKWGYDTAVAKDGGEAWDIMRQPNPPNLLLLDWMMPEMDGIDICRKLRAETIANPPYIILLTALTDKERIVEGLNSGADDYITKPYDPAELKARIRSGVRSLELQSALLRRAKRLQEALAEIKVLRGIIPICMYCHKVRKDNESWLRIEKYIEEHSDAQFSHGICPECKEKHFAGLGDKNVGNK